MVIILKGETDIGSRAADYEIKVQGMSRISLLLPKVSLKLQFVELAAFWQRSNQSMNRIN